MTKKKIIVMTALLTILSVSLLASMPEPRVSYAASNISYNESYVRAGIQYSTTTSLGSSEAQYQTTEASYDGVAANHTVALNTTNYVGTTIGGPTSVTFSVNSEYFIQNGTVKVNLAGNGGTLLYASVEQDSESQIIWTGIARINSSSSEMISGPAYINGSQSAVLTLGFAGAQSIENASSKLGTSTDVTLSVPKLSFKEASNLTTNVEVNVQMPARYSSLNIDGASINSSANLVAPVATAGVSSYANSTLPDIVWRASADSSASFQSSTVPANFSSMTTEFFGTNGSAAGFVQILNLNSNHSMGIAGANTNFEVFDSSALMLHSTNSDVTSNAPGRTVEVGGQLVVIQTSRSGLLDSTANIELQHQVSLNGTFDTLVMLSTNSTNSAYFLIDGSSNASATVNPVAPSSESQTTITVNSTSYSAMLVNISASGNIIFNVSTPFPNVIVFKETASGMVQLNSSNYWEANGRAYVFDDPSSAYYIANGVQSAGSQSSFASASISSSASATSETSSFNGLALVAILAVVVIVGGIVAMTIRRKPKT